MFRLEVLAYLGYIISTHGVRPDPDKLSVVVEWPIPSTIKQVQAFLELTGYYRRFIHQYAQIVAPLTNLLRKDGFVWTEDATTAFDRLKTTIMTASVLVFPNFSIPFVVETDACKVGIGVVLLQHKHPIAYFSRKLSNLWQRASTYSKELWALTESIQKWWHYLLGSTFTIRTDHSSLKNLLGEIIQSPEQQYFFTQLLGFTFTIEYKRGKENGAADALSQLPTIKSEIGALQLQEIFSSLTLNWAYLLVEENKSNPWICDLTTKIQFGDFDPDYTTQGRIVCFWGRFCVGPQSNL